MSNSAHKRGSENESQPYKRSAKTMRVTAEGKLNQKYVSDTLKSNFIEAYQKKQELNDGGVRIITDPFPCGVLPDFIDGEGFLEYLSNELLALDFHDKNNDLYKFKQSDDLQNVNMPYITALRNILYNDFKPILTEITGIPFNDTISMTCSKYSQTDTLLCHDDELEGRRVAFILYLVPRWDSKDGGLLNLFGTDEHGQPDKVVTSLCPAWNNFVFFEVSPVSFHEVSEVLAENKTRLSVSGWFHGAPFERPKPYVEPPLSGFREAGSVDEEMFRSWINPMYLETDVQTRIQEQFQDISEIQLQDFLQEEKFFALWTALESSEIKWVMQGPPNKRHFSRASEETLPLIARECMEFFRSEAMFLILSNLTGLTLHELIANCKGDEESEEENSEEDGQESGMHPKPQDKDKNQKCTDGGTDSGNHSTAKKKNDPATQKPRCHIEVRHWKQGSYTLLHDGEEFGEYALEANLCFCSKDWNIEFGGHTSYIARGEDEELLTVQPCPNSLSLVYRDEDTLRFTKYINSNVRQLPTKEQSFYDIHIMYYE